MSKPLARLGMNATSVIGLSPLGPYHALMYGESMYFDLSHAYKTLNYKSKYSNSELFAESYDWYVANRDAILAGEISGSGHQSKLRQGILSVIPYMLWW